MIFKQTRQLTSEEATVFTRSLTRAGGRQVPIKELVVDVGSRSKVGIRKLCYFIIGKRASCESADVPPLHSFVRYPGLIHEQKNPQKNSQKFSGQCNFSRQTK